MCGKENGMDSVFCNATDDELEFDVLFDQEDSLIDTVNGVNENGEPLTGSDFEGTTQTKPDDNSVDGELNKDSDADDFYGDADDDYQDGEKGPKVDEDSVCNTIDKVVESGDIDDFMMDEEEDDLVDEMAMLESMGMVTYVNEKARFSFLPRFKQYPELSKMYGAIEDAEDLLNDTDVDPKTGINKVGKVILRILDIYYNVVTTITLPMCIMIGPIIPHLFGRLIEYVIKVGEEAVAENEAKKIIRALDKVEQKANDPKKKAEIAKRKEQVQQKLKNMKKGIDESYDMAVLESMGMVTYVNEKATFSFLPRFKQYPELSKMYDVIEDAEDLLNDKDVDPNTGLEKVGKVILRILDIWYNINAVITLPMCIMITPIIPHLVGRLIEYAIKVGEEAVAESEAKKIIKSLKRIEDKTKDPKQKAEIAKKREQVEKKLKNMKKGIDESYEVTLEDFDEEIRNEASVVDPEVASIESEDDDEDSEVIDAAMGNTEKKSKYSYDLSDEELIDMVLNEE